MKVYKSFLFFWGLFFLLECRGSFYESEPENNMREGAMPMESGKKYKGTFYAQDNPDVDFYFVSANYPLMVKGELSGVKGVDSSFAFYRQGESQPFKIINDGQSSLGEQFGPLQVKSPGMWIAVRSAQLHSQEEYKKLKYTFTISTFAPPSFMEQEGNDSAPLAQAFDENSDGLILGYYNNVFFTENELERDFFVYKISQEGRMLVNLDLSAVTGIDPIVRVYDSDGVLLMSADEKGLSQGESIRSLAVQAPTQLIISVNAKDFLTNFSEYYQLKVNHNPYESRYEAEPNDSFETASAILEERTFGQLSDAFDKDFFSLKNTLNQAVFVGVEVLPTAGLDIRLEATLPSGEILQFDDASAEGAEGFSNIFLESGKELFFYIQAKGDFPKTSASYTIITHFVPVSDNMELENNNMVAQANAMDFDSEYMGYINPNDDVDFWRVHSHTSERARLLVKGIEGCKIKISVADSDGIVLNSYVTAKAGEGISQNVDLPVKAILKVECTEVKKNIYQHPYTLKLLKGHL